MAENQRPRRTDLVVQDYSDYRLFLSDYCASKKAAAPGWSLGVWSRQLGVPSRSSLSRVLKGERTPGNQLIRKLEVYFGFNEEEAAHFKALVQLGKLQKDGERSLRVLKNIRAAKRRGFLKIDDSTIEACAHWINPLLTGMVKHKDFREDPKWIAERANFPISPKEVTEAIQKLLEIGILTRNEFGRLASTEWQLPENMEISEAKQQIFNRFYAQALGNTLLLAEKSPENRGSRTFNTMMLSSKDLPRLKKFIRNFIDELGEEFHCQEGDLIYQLQLQFYPLLRSKDE